MTADQTYLIRRFCFKEEHPDHRRVINRGLTLEQVQAHCNDPLTKGLDAERGMWFDGYERES
jgi:hypothetical protein